MKTWKIVLIILAILVVLFIGFVFYNGYQYSKFYDNAEDLRPSIFGSDWFNQRLISCSLAYSDKWEIRGLENNKCVVSFIWDNSIDYNEGKITNNWVSCNLPYEIYNQAESIEWNELVNSEYCDF